MSEKKIIRLNKVLREFNISMDRAVEYLSANGHKIESRPTTKISDEIYSILKSKFENGSSKNQNLDQQNVDGKFKDGLDKIDKDKIYNSIFYASSALAGPVGWSLAAGKFISDKYSQNEKKEILKNTVDYLKATTMKEEKRSLEINNNSVGEKMSFSNLKSNEFTDELIQHERDLNEENSYDFAITNFRRADKKWSFDLSPVTFLIGTNNSGKSSMLKSLLVLEDYANSNNHLELSFNGPNYKKHKIDQYANAVNWKELENNNGQIKFEFRRFGYYIQLIFEPQSRDSERMLKANLTKLKVRRLSDDSQFKLKRISEGQYQLYVEYDILSIKDEDSSYYTLLQNMGMKTMFEKSIEKLEEERSKLNSSDPKSISLKQELNQNKRRLKEVNAKINNLESERKNKFVFEPQFSIKEFHSDKLTLSNILQKVLNKYFEDNEKEMGKIDEKEELLKILNFGDRLMSSLKFNTHHLSPQRNSQTRLYLNENTSNDIYELINWHSENPLNPGDNPYVFIQDHMKVFDIGDDFRIKDIEGLASIIEIHENGQWRNIVDKGFGVGQLFSIIFRIGLCINDYDLEYGDIEYSFKKIKPIILIEEPEGNLHPKLQSKLADLFYEAYLDHGVRFIVETHSEYLIRRSQVLMSKWKGEDSGYEDQETRPFGAFYFDLKSGPYNMNYRQDGKFKKDFGPGFFDEGSNLAFDIL